MRDILVKGCTLEWERTPDNRGPIDYPQVKQKPYPNPRSGVEGKVILECADGSVWECLFSDFADVAHDYELVVIEWRDSLSQPS